MSRTLIIVFVLAVLCAGAANGLPASPARPHKGAVRASASHPSQSAAASHKHAGHAAARASGNASTHAAGRTAERASSRAARQAPARERAASRNTHPAARGQVFRSHQLSKSRPARRKFRRGAQTNAADRPARVETVSLRRTRIAMPPPLRGSYESLVRQNEKSEIEGLERIQDDNDLNDRIARGMLVPVPASKALTVNGNLPQNRRYCRPWTAKFLADLGNAHAAQFHKPLEVSSAVRTVAYQKQLMKVNGNATAAEGDIASPHLTGATIDIAKQGLSQQEIGWMRAVLLPLEKAGKIDVEEEFQQSCFHITVYKEYALPASVPSQAAVQAVPGRSGF